MVAINPRQRHAASFARIGGRFVTRLSAPATEPSREDDHDDMLDNTSTLNLIVRGGRMKAALPGNGQEEYEVKRIWAKRKLNKVVLYLVQWENYEEMHWIPQGDISWQALSDFEREYADSVWDYQSTRGRRQVLRRERPARTSQRIRGKWTRLCCNASYTTFTGVSVLVSAQDRLHRQLA